MDDKRTQKNIRRNRRRRGVVIEMAMLMMVVVVALSGLLTSTAIMQLNKQSSSAKQLEQLEQRMALDQIGRDFCTHLTLPTLPDGMTGVITRTGCTSPDCCKGCTECDDIYAPPEPGDAENSEGTENPGSETAEGSELPEGDGITAVQRPKCCKECGCRTGCTKYTHISLVVYDKNDNPVLMVVMSHDVENGTHTVIQWSYVG